MDWPRIHGRRLRRGPGDGHLLRQPVLRPRHLCRVAGNHRYLQEHVRGRAGNGVFDDNHAAGAWLAYWVNPNTDIGARFWWEGNDDYNRHAVGIFGEHRFAANPWSIWAGAEFGHLSATMSDYNFWEADVGVTYFFDPPGTSLRDHYHTMPF